MPTAAIVAVSELPGTVSISSVPPATMLLTLATLMLLAPAVAGANSDVVTPAVTGVETRVVRPESV